MAVVSERDGRAFDVCGAAADRRRPCSRRAPGPARRSRSPPSRPATSPPGRRSRSCCSSRSGGRPPASCATACAAGSSSAEAGARRRPRRRRRRRRATSCSPSSPHAPADERAAAGGPTSPAPSPTSTRRRSRRPTGSAAACCTASGSPATSSRGRHVRRGRHRPRRRGRRRPLPPQVRPPATRDFTLAVARRIGREVVGRPDAAIAPAGEPADTPAGLRQRLAVAVRAEVERRKRQRRSLTYDDLLTRLAATLRDPVRGPARLRPAARALLGRDGRRVPGHRPDAVGDRRSGRSATAPRRSC